MGFWIATIHTFSIKVPFMISNEEGVTNSSENYFLSRSLHKNEEENEKDLFLKKKVPLIFSPWCSFLGFIKEYFCPDPLSLP